MFRNHFLIFAILFNVTKYCESILTDTQKNIIESLNEKLNVKHFIIIKGDNVPIDQDIFHFAKIISEGKIFMSFLSVSEMDRSMTRHYKTPIKYYYEGYHVERERIARIRDAWVYPPKTIVIPLGEIVEYSIGELFKKKHRLAVSKYIWLAFDDNVIFTLFSKSKANYIPFNCQFLIVKKIMEDQDDYAIEEIYHSSKEKYELFVRRFGKWNEVNGLAIWEPDFYKRRYDMNGTVLEAFYSPGYESNTDFQLNVADIISRVMNIRWELKPLRFTEDQDVVWAINLGTSLISYINFSPFFIGPFEIGTNSMFCMGPVISWVLFQANNFRSHFFLAYDRKYEQLDISPLAKPFSLNLWMTLLGWLILSAISITAIVETINRRLKSESNSRIKTSDCLYEPFDSILNQDGGKIPGEAPVKIISLASRIVALILGPLYTGAIASFILIPIIKLPFTNPKEFVQDGSYKLGFMPMTNLELALKDSNDHWMQEISRNFLIPINGSFEDALDKGIKTMCDDNKFAVIYNSLKDLENDIGCTIIRINSPVISGWAVMFLEFESPYRAVFNRIVTWIRSTGNFRAPDHEFIEKGGGDFTIIEANDNNKDDNEVYLASLGPVFILAGVLYALSVIILLAEIRWNKNKKKSRISTIWL